MKKSKTTIRTAPDKDVTVYERIASDILKITEDKLKLKLKNLKISIESKSNIFLLCRNNDCNNNCASYSQF